MAETTKRPVLAKLLEIKKKIPSFQKDTKGFNYEYASPQAVLGVVNPLLNEAGLFVKMEVTEVISSARIVTKTKSGEKEETLIVLRLRFTIVDTASGDFETWEFAATGCNGEDKSFGSALTYGERYFFLKLFSAPQNKEDPDSVSKHRAQGTDDFDLG